MNKQNTFLFFFTLLGSIMCWIVCYYICASGYFPEIDTISFNNFEVCQQKVADMNISDKDFSNIHFAPIDKRRFIARLLCTHSNARYLEWGSGGSTELLSVFPNNIQIAYSIEHAVPWCERMLKTKVVANAIKLQTLVFKCVNTGQPLKKWGVPEKNANISAMQIYIDMIDNFTETHFDIVLIDGRFRVACALKLLIGNYVDNTSIVIINDYYNRLEYSVVERYYKILDAHEVYRGSEIAEEKFIATGRMGTMQKMELNDTMKKQLVMDFDIYKNVP